MDGGTTRYIWTHGRKQSKGPLGCRVSEGARQACHTCIMVQRAPQRSHLFKFSPLPVVHVWGSCPCSPCVQMSVRLLWEPLSIELLAGVSRCHRASSLSIVFVVHRATCLLHLCVDVTETCRHITCHQNVLCC